MSPFELLGVPDDASERDVRRAYASLLKKNRPDDDPAAFQTLNEAYRHALAEVSWRVSMGADEHFDHDDEMLQLAPAADSQGDGASGVLEAPAIRLGLGFAVAHPATAPSVGDAEAPAFDVARFLRQFAEQARTRSATALLVWLQSVDALYNLELKARVGPAVAEALWDDEIGALDQSRIDAVESFFGLALGTGIVSRQRALAAVRTEDTSAYDEYTATAIRQLKRPHRPWQATAVTLVPGLASRIGMLARRLRHDADGPLPGIDHEQADFFESLVNPVASSRPWRAQVAARTVVWSLLAGTLLGALLAEELRPFAYAKAIGSAAGVIGVGQVFWRLRSALLLSRYSGWRSTWGIASLAGGTLVAATLFSLNAATQGVALALGGIAIALALHHRAQLFDAIRMAVGGITLATGIPFLSDGAGAGLALAATLLAGTDAAFAQRHGLSYAHVAGNSWTRVLSYVVFLGAMVARSALP